MERIKFSLFGPLIPHASLYIDCNTKDIVTALSSPLLTYNTTPLSLQPYNPSTSCYGCRVRQLHHRDIDGEERSIDTVIDTVRSHSLLSFSHESTTDIHWDIIRLWSKSWVQHTSPVSMAYHDTEELQQHRLCSHCDPVPQSHGLPTPPHTYNIMVGLSVRSLLDAYLSYKNFPKGSILLLSAINIPDMNRVVRAHGLIPLPIDLELGTTSTNLEALEQTILHYGVYRADADGGPGQDPGANGRICCFMTSYVFGVWVDLEPLFKLAHKYNIPVIEDAAEAFTHPHFTGFGDSDLSLFSFGSIKYATAFGGGIARVKDWDTYYGMLTHIANQPCHSNRQYFDKVKRILPVSIALNTPLVAASIVRSARLVGVDHKARAVSMLRGFPGELIAGIRHQPSAALLYMLRHRFANETIERLGKSRVKGAFLEECLEKGDVDADILGPQAVLRSYWLFPLLVRDPTSAVAQLDSYGVDVYRGATQLACLPLPNELTLFSDAPSPQFPLPLHTSQQIMKHILYLPIHKNTPNRDIRRVVDALSAVCGPRRGPIISPPSSIPIQLTAAGGGSGSGSGSADQPTSDSPVLPPPFVLSRL